MLQRWESESPPTSLAPCLLACRHLVVVSVQKGDMVDGAVFVFPPKRQTLTNTLQFDQVSESQTVALATVYNACSSMYHSYHPT